MYTKVVFFFGKHIINVKIKTLRRKQNNDFKRKALDEVLSR